ncbi:MAG: adenylate/guanylate cyclase domain-containing protein [Actinobacteria bacterium]|nr:adenylate/guanylate cyclase domain-containing protein [Actinomycetota bacterium]
MPSPIRYARSGDLSIAYRVEGSGPDLLVAPGFISHLEWAMDEPVVARFSERLASFSRVIVFDKRGCGLSDPVSGPPSLEENVQDMRAVLDAVGSERAVIFGVSEGGSTAMLFAATHPVRTAALILYGSYARVLRAPDYPFGVGSDEHQVLIDMTMERWGDGVGLSAWAPSAGDDPRLRESWARLQRLAASPAMVRRIFELYRDIDIRPVLPSIRVPTLVLHRRDDRMVPVAMAHYLADHLPDAKLVELEGTDHTFFTGDTRVMLDELEEFATGTVGPQGGDRVLATVLFTDIVSSTERAIAMGDARWRDLLETHHAQVTSQIERFEGREVKSLGDGFLAVFDGPARAIRCAQAISDRARSIGLDVRAGLHTGECETIGDDIGGIAVHIAARVAALGQGDEVLVSSTVKDLVAGSGIVFEDRGSHALKGVDDEWRLFAALR